MEVIGKIEKILNTETRGTPPKEVTIKKIIIKTAPEGKYPNSVAVDFLNANVDKLTEFKVGDEVMVKINLRSKEYQSKWYTNAVAWAINLKQEPVVSKDQLPDSNDGNDLPF